VKTRYYNRVEVISNIVASDSVHGLKSFMDKYRRKSARFGQVSQSKISRVEARITLHTMHFS